MHFGLGGGTLNGTKDFQNPLRYIDEQFNNRPENYEDEGGQFQPSRYFSGKDVSPFFGLSYVLNDKFILKAERDTTLTPASRKLILLSLDHKSKDIKKLNMMLSKKTAPDRKVWLEKKGNLAQTS